VIAALATGVCENPEEAFESIRKEIGPQPQVGLAEFDEYVRIESCMYLLEMTLDACRDFIRETMSR
jgi:hypothetical protein